MRSWVRCGIDLAAGDRLMTRDTVAGESPRCSARNFKLTVCAAGPPRGRADAPVLGRVMGCSIRVVSHTELGRASGEVQLRSANSKCAERNRQAPSWTDILFLDFMASAHQARIMLLTTPVQRVLHAHQKWG